MSACTHPIAPRRAGRAALVLALLFLAAAAVAVVAYLVLQKRAQKAPGPIDGKPAATDAPADMLARETAAGYFANDKRGDALKALKPLIERADPTADDLVSAAVVQMSLGAYPEAKTLLERAAKLAPDSARVQFNLGRLARDDGDFDAAARHLRAALLAAPDDLPTQILLATVIEKANPAEAEALFRKIVDRGVDTGGSWYMGALYHLATTLLSQGKETEALKLLELHQDLAARGLTSPSEPELARGNLGRILPPPPIAGPGPALAAAPAFAAPTSILPELAGMRLVVTDADNDGRMDLLGFGKQGVALALNQPKGWKVVQLAKGSAMLARAFDLGEDDDMDVLWVDESGNVAILEAVRNSVTREISWRPWEKSMPPLAEQGPRGVFDVAFADYDHDGDLDIVVVGEFGARLLRNDGAAARGEQGGFSDATEEAGLPKGRAFEWVVAEDFDTDQDVDLLFGGGQGAYLASNLRGGRFEDMSRRVAGLAHSSVKPLVADLDHDGRPDLWSPADPANLLLGKPSGDFVKSPAHVPALPFADWRAATLADVDLDGFFDALGIAGGDGTGPLRAALVRAPGWSATQASELALGDAARLATADLAFDDFDGDLLPDLVVTTQDGVDFHKGTGPFGNSVRLGFRAKKDNRRAVGAIVEMRAGDRYQRLWWPGEAKLVGVGSAGAVQWRRILWPNGIVQWDLTPDLGDRTIQKEAFGGLEQSEGLRGSCPFLYTWNGEKNVFVSDVLGITPLGLPMAPGMLVPPDHDEYVLVRGDQLVPKDGFLDLHFTEELREVTFLDRIRLDVVDHPAGTQIYPNERFSFPPFPEPHTHTVRDALEPLRATGSGAKDWTDALARVDDVYAAPFEVAPPQFLGLATPHVLELEFDPVKLADAKKLRLVMTGWFYWTDASVNMAAARDPVQEFIPPTLSFPDGQGGWRDLPEPIGFPAGKTKTMVVDVTDLLDRNDPRVRISDTLRLYWDSIRLAVDDDDAELVVASLEPASAKLWRRGFSAPVAPTGPNQPERFEWEHVSDVPLWNPHPGLYTKYGESLPLLTDVDDRYVVMASGDALSVRFDATKLAPPRAGFVRDYLVFLDGWAKDRDPNTLDAMYVEPLPFHGMSGYPYGPDERFPDDDAHRAWRREWLVRQAEDWFPRLAAEMVQPPFATASAPRN